MRRFEITVHLLLLVRALNRATCVRFKNYCLPPVASLNCATYAHGIQSFALVCLRAACAYPLLCLRSPACAFPLFCLRARIHYFVCVLLLARIHYFVCVRVGITLSAFSCVRVSIILSACAYPLLCLRSPTCNTAQLSLAYSLLLPTLHTLYVPPNAYWAQSTGSKMFCLKSLHFSPPLRLWNSLPPSL